jgi:hypothetical protein
MGPIGIQELLLVCLPLIVIALIPLCKISRRTGHSPWWGLVTLFPIVGFLIWSYYVAYGKWPVENKTTRAFE